MFLKILPGEYIPLVKYLRLNLLVVYFQSFECEECGLVLDDTQELELAGMDVVYERDSDLERFMRENRDMYEA